MGGSRMSSNGRGPDLLAPERLVARCNGSRVSDRYRVLDSGRGSRAGSRPGYGSGMGVRAGSRMEPERRLPELDGWLGSWVAIKAGLVVAAAPTSGELVVRVREQGSIAAGAVAQFSPEPTDDIVIGLG